jgi:CBS domain-containing protein
MLVKELMKQPYVADKDISLLEAARIMSKKDVGSLIFVKNNKAKGIITDSDLLKSFGKSKRISHVMSKNLISIGPDERVEGALKIMKENKIKRLPVVDAKKHLSGIISMTDIAANADILDEEFFFN